MEKKDCQKKEKNIFIKILLKVLYVILALILVLAIWIGFSVIDKKKSLAMIPQGYHAFFHTDSFYESVNPLLDLQAADILLSSDKMSNIRGIFMNLRENEIRNNKIIKFLLTRKIDAGLYTKDKDAASFVISVDFGLLSSITRLSKFIIPALNIKEISFIQEYGISYYTFTSNDLTIYFKPVKNLLVASNDFEKFKIAIEGNNDLGYTDEQLEVLNKKIDNPIKLVINTSQVINTFFQGSMNLSSITNLLFDETTLSIVSFGITDQELSLNIDLPINQELNSTDNQTVRNLLTILEKNSTSPDIISNLSNVIQYYTVLNVDTLENLIALAAPIMMNDSSENLINKYNGLAKSFLAVTIEDLLFSWTDKEFALLGIENLNDPVIAVKIKDEKKRKEIFDSVLNSFILKENKSLILNGVRIPRIEIPGFLQGILKMIGFSIPKPYYLVYNNYIYFSESAESISTIYSTFSNGSNISHNKNWKAVSEDIQEELSVSLFYDLERSRPFFINSLNEISKIFELYSIGRADLKIINNSIALNLKALSRREGYLRNIPGFPIEIVTSKNPKLYTADVKKPSTIFWLENEQTVKALDLKKTEIYSYELPSKGIIQATQKGGKEYVMALTQTNELFILNNNLEVEPSFTKIKLPEQWCSIPHLDFETSYIPVKSGKIYKIKNKNLSIIDTEIENFDPNISQIFYNGKYGFIYQGFMQDSFIIFNDKIINKDSPIFVDKFGFTAPTISKIDNNLYSLGILFQSGDITIYTFDSEKIIDQKNIQLNGIFYNTQLIYHNDSYYALSSTGELFKISNDGSVLSIQIDNVKTNNYFSLKQIGNKHCLCVGIDGNRIYAFSENLELVSGFPVAGIGEPIFADVTGDNYPDCFAQTIDNKLNAWNLR